MKIITALILITFAPLAASAAPSISGITGTISQGSQITISGSELISQNTAGWTSFFNTSNSSFEGSSPVSDGYGLNGGSVVSYDSAVRLFGNRSIKGIASGAHAYSNYGTEQSYYYDPGDISMSDLYMRIYSRWSYNQWPSEDHKFFWLNGHFLNLIPNGGSAPSRIGYMDGPEWYYGDIPGGAIKNDKWYCIELHKRRTSSPYTIEVWIDGTRVINAVSGQSGPSASGWGWENNTNYWGTSSGFSGTQWQDAFAIGSQRLYPLSTIEIGNSSNFATAAKTYQSPVYLSDNSITITADLSGLGAGPYYLWVTNNRQERSAAYALSGVQTDTTPPAAPTGLSVR